MSSIKNDVGGLAIHWFDILKIIFVFNSKLFDPQLEITIKILKILYYLMNLNIIQFFINLFLFSYIQ